MASPGNIAALGPNDVHIRVRADARNLPVVRTVIQTVAMRADHTIDDISDLELAVDECCSALILDATEEAVLTCTFSISDDGITVHASTPSRTSEPPPESTFGWRVLTTLIDEVKAWVDSDGDGHKVHVEMLKRRPD